MNMDDLPIEVSMAMLVCQRVFVGLALGGGSLFKKTVGNHVQLPCHTPVIYRSRMCYIEWMLFPIPTYSSVLHFKPLIETKRGYDGYTTNSLGCLNHCFLEVFLNHQLISSHMQWRPASCRLEYPVAATTAWAPWWQVFGKLNKKQQVQK